jgi:hypothetical protein
VFLYVGSSSYQIPVPSSLKSSMHPNSRSTSESITFSSRWLMLCVSAAQKQCRSLEVVWMLRCVKHVYALYCLCHVTVMMIK